MTYTTKVYDLCVIRSYLGSVRTFKESLQNLLKDNVDA